MSACDSCIRPGACCKDFPLPALGDRTKLEAMVFIATYWHPLNPLPGLPFIDLRRVEGVAGSYGQEPYTGWIASCLWLGDDGRCTEYAHRPHWPCGAYEPGQDALCAHHVPQIGLCPDLKEPSLIFSNYLKDQSP